MEEPRRWPSGRVFALSFLASLLVLGLMMAGVLVRLCAPARPLAGQQPKAAASAVYLPTAADRLTLLLAVEGTAPESDAFLLVGFYPDIAYIPAMALPRRLALGEKDLQQLCRAEGSQAAAEALETTFGLEIDRVAALPAAALAGLVDRAGSVDFGLETAVEDHLSGLRLPAGLHRFDGQKTAALLSAGWPQGEPQRCAALGGLAAQLLNSHLPMVLGEEWAGFFKALVNGCRVTDLTSLDFEQYLPAARFMARLANAPAQPLELSGGATAAGAFAPDAAGVTLLQNTFGPQQK